MGSIIIIYTSVTGTVTLGRIRLSEYGPTLFWVDNQHSNYRIIAQPHRSSIKYLLKANLIYFGPFPSG